jgi:hypothetical protein
LPKFFPGADALWSKVVEPRPCVIFHVQRQQQKGIISRSTAGGDDSYKVVELNSRVLLPIELDYAIAELDSLWQ